MSVGTPHRPNTAAVKRDFTSHIFSTSPFTDKKHGIIELIAEGDGYDGKQNIVSVDGEMVQTVENTPLAATVVWDNSQINLYYLAPSTNGIVLREICQRHDAGWVNGALSDFLIQKGVFPHPNATITAWTTNVTEWNHREDLNVYFKSTTDKEKEITLAKYLADDSAWQIRKIGYE